jgi:hypothetical protein
MSAIDTVREGEAAEAAEAAEDLGPQRTQRSQRGESLSARDGGAVRQELDVLASGRLVRIAVVALLVSVVGVVCAGLLLRRTTGPLRAGSGESAGALVSTGREIAGIEQTPILVSRDGIDLRDREREELSRAAWIDRDAGVAAIPIERAMEMIERGANGERREGAR